MEAVMAIPLSILCGRTERNVECILKYTTKFHSLEGVRIILCHLFYDGEFFTWITIANPHKIKSIIPTPENREIEIISPLLQAVSYAGEGVRGLLREKRETVEVERKFKTLPIVAAVGEAPIVERLHVYGAIMLARSSWRQMHGSYFVHTRQSSRCSFKHSSALIRGGVTNDNMRR